MIRLTKLIITIVGCYFISCNNDLTEVEESSKQFEKNTIIIGKYPELIESNNLTIEYDVAVWSLYVINHKRDKIFCEYLPLEKTTTDSIVNYKDDNLISYKLKLDSLGLFGDTILMNFSFYKEENYRCLSPYIKTRVIFIKGDTTPYFGNYFSWWGISPKLIEVQKYAQEKRKEKISDNEISDYSYWYYEESFSNFLKTTKYSINNWVKDEAKRRNILIDKDNN